MFRGGKADVEVIIYAINTSVRAEVKMALQKNWCVCLNVCLFLSSTVNSCCYRKLLLFVLNCKRIVASYAVFQAEGILIDARSQQKGPLIYYVFPTRDKAFDAFQAERTFGNRVPSRKDLW